MKAALRMVIVVGALAFGPISTLAADQQTTAAKPSDKTIDDQVEARLRKDGALRKHDIDVSVDDGVVKLTGTVSSVEDSVRATRLATVPGTTRVDNRLIIDLSGGSSSRAKGTTGTMKTGSKGATAGAGSQVKDDANKAVDKTKAGLSKTGEVITDGWITTRVKSTFVGEDLLKDSNINVDTNNHVVTLKGTVMSQAAKARAAAQAKTVEGVQRVVNQLTVAAKR